MCVGSNPTPVRKRFEHDEAEPSADKFCHAGRSIQDDSPKQKKTNDSQRHWVVDSRAVRKCTKKEDTRWRHVKHDSTRVFKFKSFQIDDTNRLADYISELKMSLNWKDTDQKEICRRKQAGCRSGLRRQTQEIRSSRILVHECVRGFESQSCQKTFWTRRGRAFSWQILSYWNVNSRWQFKAKENKRLATSLGGW